MIEMMHQMAKIMSWEYDTLLDMAWGDFLSMCLAEVNIQARQAREMNQNK